MTSVRVARFGAVDFGAASGRVIVGEVGPSSVTLDECHRFVNRPVRAGGTLHWDILSLYQEMLDGLRKAGPGDGIGIDAWVVDYGLLDGSGGLLGTPVHYRDERTSGARENLERLGARELYATTGLQFLPFNTIHQLMAETRLGAARRLLMIPDLLAYWLTGEQGAEVTNASTTQLLDVRTRAWATELIEKAGVDPALLPPLREPGTVIGSYGGTPVIAVGSHDTASAVVGCPRPASGSPTSPAGPGRWSGSSSAGPCSRMPAGRPTSPTSSASTGPCGTCATSWDCGCCRNARGSGAPTPRSCRVRRRRAPGAR